MIRLYTMEEASSYLNETQERSLIVGHNRRSLAPYIRKVYVRNDNPLYWYSNISIWSTSTGVDLFSGTGLFGVKFYFGAAEPTSRMWAGIPFNQPALINNIGTAGSPDLNFHPLYIKHVFSPSQDIGMYGDGSFRITQTIHGV